MTGAVDVLLNAGWAHGKGWTDVDESLVTGIVEIDVPVLESMPEVNGLRYRTELYGYTNRHTRPNARPVLVFRHIANLPELSSPPLQSYAPREVRPIIPQADADPLSWRSRRHDVTVWPTPDVMWAKCWRCDWWGGVLLHTTRRTEAEAMSKLLDQHPEVKL